MITQPTVKPSRFTGHESDFGTSIAISLWRRLIDSHRWVDKSLPIGYLMMFFGAMTEADGDPVSPPNPNIWKFCNGQTISDAESLLNGVTLPDLRGKFLKANPTLGLTGGQATINLNHNHGGFTGVLDDSEEVNADSGSEKDLGAPHQHPMDSAWSSTESIIPKHFAVQYYVRYK